MSTPKWHLLSRWMMSMLPTTSRLNQMVTASRNFCLCLTFLDLCAWEQEQKNVPDSVESYRLRGGKPNCLKKAGNLLHPTRHFSHQSTHCFDSQQNLCPNCFHFCQSICDFELIVSNCFRQWWVFGPSRWLVIVWDCLLRLALSIRIRFLLFFFSQELLFWH